MPIATPAGTRVRSAPARVGASHDRNDSPAARSCASRQALATAYLAKWLPRTSVKSCPANTRGARWSRMTRRAPSSVSPEYAGVVSAAHSPQPAPSSVTARTSSASLYVVVLRAVRNARTSGSRTRCSSSARTGPGVSARARSSRTSSSATLGGLLGRCLLGRCLPRNGLLGRCLLGRCLLRGGLARRAPCPTAPRP